MSGIIDVLVRMCTIVFTIVFLFLALKLSCEEAVMCFCLYLEV